MCIRDSGKDCFHRSLIACCAETICVIRTIKGRHNFQELLKALSLDPFDFWRIISNFVKFDPTMSQALTQHFRTVENTILGKLAWQESSQLLAGILRTIESCSTSQAMPLKEEELANIPTQATLSRTQSFTSALLVNSPGKENYGGERPPSEELFFKRVLQYAACQIILIQRELNLPEDLTENVWDVTKYILSNEIRLLVDRHLDQLLICSVYSVCKVKKYEMTFREIVEKWAQLPTVNKAEMEELKLRVPLRKLPDGTVEKGELIDFYNKLYVHRMKDVLDALRRCGSDDEKKEIWSRRPQVPSFVTQSPLREHVPSSLLSYKQLSSARSRVPPSPSLETATPKTKAIYAFGESPLGFKYPGETTLGKSSRRSLNFSEEEPPTFESRKRVMRDRNYIISKIIEEEDQNDGSTTKIETEDTLRSASAFLGGTSSRSSPFEGLLRLARSDESTGLFGLSRPQSSNSKSLETSGKKTAASQESLPPLLSQESIFGVHFRDPHDTPEPLEKQSPGTLCKKTPEFTFK
eukprot:TRINITY_DN3515_c0_g1_i2.p1 TRINITY_DN3515_c0_g1~~TRINITY_DN3515_c0_g1_i2.p1  ORF type:complete len:524 (+),score=97.74 TRINITY_DN3515_c0_g1_i2:81-1652(+)